MVLMNLAECGFRFVQSGIENMAQHHTLIVSKQGLGGVTCRAEFPVDGAHRLWNISAGKHIRDSARHRIVGFPIFAEPELRSSDCDRPNVVRTGRSTPIPR